jgi:hypothetical protein
MDVIKSNLRQGASCHTLQARGNNKQEEKSTMTVLNAAKAQSSLYNLFIPKRHHLNHTDLPP